MKTVLITGVAGFLGRLTAARFAREGWRVVGIDDVAPENAPQEWCARFVRMGLPHTGFGDLLRGENPRVLAHCAGRASVPLSLEDPHGDFRSNAVLVFELLDQIRCSGMGCHFLLLSSAAVYGESIRLPVDEEHPVSPVSPYGFHKRMAELACQEFAELHGLRATALRIFSAYGSGLRRQVVWDICRKALLPGRVILRGAGTETRDFVHGRDVAGALHTLAEARGEGFEVVNVGSGRETSVRELAALIFGALGRTDEPEFDGINPAGNPLRWCAGVDRLRARGIEPVVPLDLGVREVAQWCRLAEGIL